MAKITIARLIQICIFVSIVSSEDDYRGPIHFPMRNVQRSINLGNFSSSELQIYTGKCEYIANNRVILNLPNMELYPPPNPYPGFIESSYVSCLSLRENQITQITSGAFDQLPNLQYLDLSKNRLPFCDFFSFGRCQPNLKTLLIEKNEPPLDAVDKSISKADCFPQVEHLYLRKNGIRKLDFCLKQSFPRLVYLYLSDNQLDSPNFIREPPTTLRHLYAERNRIYKMGCELVKNLQTLMLDGNYIRSICYRQCSDSSLSLEGAKALTVLSVSQNKITDIEACAFDDACALINLDLSQNMICDLKRETFRRLVVLQILNLDDNLLTAIPDLRSNTLLTTLSIRRNKLAVLKRDCFTSLKSLKSLYLGGNQIRSIESDTFMELESLMELDLSYNGLEHLPPHWVGWRWNLRVLDVRGNHFTCLEHLSLGNAPYLSTIYMQNNIVKTISGVAVAKFSPNVIIHLENDCIPNPKTACYARCEEEQITIKNETYIRWVNGL